MSKIKVLIADDHKMFREGIHSLLEKEEEIIVVGEAGSSREIMNIVEEKEIDVVLMDIDLGDSSGIDSTQIITEKYPDIKVLALSMHGESNYIVKMLDAGATGYILKNTGRDEMISAIKTVAAGDSYYSSQVSAKLIEQLHRKTGPKKDKKDVPLSNREIEVLKLISEEYSNPEIAEKLFISIRTVDTHRRNLLEKLGVKNTAGLVKYAISKGLLDAG